MRTEAEALLADPNADTTRLFELFLQREDMENFAKDFRDLEAMIGPMEESDPFNWSQFRLDCQEDFDRLEANLQEIEERDNVVPRSLKKLVSPESVKKTAAPSPASLPKASTAASQYPEGAAATTELLFPTDDEEAEEELETILMRDVNTGEEKRVRPPDARSLRDQDGHLWTGVILNNDTTQKITPGVRILSFRTLVVIGNARGTAGFGKGKGLTAELSLASAFR